MECKIYKRKSVWMNLSGRAFPTVFWYTPFDLHYYPIAVLDQRMCMGHLIYMCMQSVPIVFLRNTLLPMLVDFNSTVSCICLVARTRRQPHCCFTLLGLLLLQSLAPGAHCNNPLFCTRVLPPILPPTVAAFFSFPAVDRARFFQGWKQQ